MVMTTANSLCLTCRRRREVITGKGSRFVLCTLSQSNPQFAKYPPQPVGRCEGYMEQKSSQKRVPQD